jgi:branched-chain amino acid transport system permease protein
LTFGPGKIAIYLLGVLILLSLPYVISSYGLRVLDLSLISAIAVIGLCFAFGYAGLLNLGQAAFVGIGAYASALLAARFGLGFWLTMPCALLITAAAAIVVGVPMLRLRGHYLALATVGLNVTTEIVAKNWESMTGGEDGLSAIPNVGLGAFRFDSDRRFFYLTVVALAIVMAIGLAIRHSRFGRAMIAVRDDELASGASGVSVLRTKVAAFTLAAIFGALSGTLYAHYANYISPSDFDFVHSIALLVMLIVGGETSMIGAIGGAILIGFAPELLRFVGEAYLAVFGIGVVLVLVLMPDGVVGTLSRLWRTQLGRHV